MNEGERFPPLHLNISDLSHLVKFLPLEDVAAGVHPEAPQAYGIAPISHAQLRPEITAQRDKAMEDYIVPNHPRTEHGETYRAGCQSGP